MAAPHPSTPSLDADTAIASAPLPTAKTLRRRSSLPLQLLRFAVLNLRMLRMVAKGHGDVR